MKTWFWVVLVVCLGLAGYLVWSLAAGPKATAKSASVPFEVGAESVAVYEQRVAELETQVDNLKKRMVAVGTAERREVKARLARFEAQIADLRRAIAKWRVARGGDAPNEAYRQCLILYGEARGVCGALAPDTLGRE
ncbi:hypothetical protein FJY68_09945 [candidate division WOR-3 bacterium]|uniref:Uncharacterized protein n=1 Tax=candidate division WOR-3 bacterium TaxID=2052148 RepID=A0A937XGR1_UNCW3|nr:hypothetical protein [candidate division WOR-3 bacterium]